MTNTKKAPGLDVGLGWFNTDKPLRFDRELQGQVVVLDFWTYCCIDCMHILPDLASLERKYKDQPVVFVGVHSAKFTNESSRETIRAAIQRYDIAHPVVIDDDMKIWRAYGARSWPTLFVVSSTGNIAMQTSGQDIRKTLDRGIAQALQQGRSAGTLAENPLRLEREATVRAASGLLFPGKVLADENLNRLFIADSNHHRIVMAELPDNSGRANVVKVVGSGMIGQADGPADDASFHHPQGMAVALGHLYVADTENHLIRAIDLETYEVSTVVGTGKMEWDRAGGGMGTQQGLNSPWDLTSEGSTLYVAMAGCHQIWRIDLPVGFARAFAGTGRENLVDGPAETAALSQPSGICTAGGKLYFADSEVSAVRGIDMATERVFTIIGEGLFSFGDVDGTHPKAKLQHPLAVDGWGTALIVADTYNHKIKLVDPVARDVRTLFGTGEPATNTPDGQAAFFEPGGVSVCGNVLFVADTNNHRILRVDLHSATWCEVMFDGLATPVVYPGQAQPVIQAEPTNVDAASEVRLELIIEFPEGASFNPEAPWSIHVSCNGSSLAQRTCKGAATPMRVNVPRNAIVAGDWDVRTSFTFCTDSGGGMCVPGELRWRLPVATSGDQSRLRLTGVVGS